MRTGGDCPPVYSSRIIFRYVCVRSQSLFTDADANALLNEFERRLVSLQVDLLVPGSRRQICTPASHSRFRYRILAQIPLRGNAQFAQPIHLGKYSGTRLETLLTFWKPVRTEMRLMN
jgi:hypothetical protein